MATIETIEKDVKYARSRTRDLGAKTLGPGTRDHKTWVPGTGIL